MLLSAQLIIPEARPGPIESPLTFLRGHGRLISLGPVGAGLSIGGGRSLSPGAELLEGLLLVLGPQAGRGAEGRTGDGEDGPGGGGAEGGSTEEGGSSRGAAGGDTEERHF